MHHLKKIPISNNIELNKFRLNSFKKSSNKRQSKIWCNIKLPKKCRLSRPEVNDYEERKDTRIK